MSATEAEYPTGDAAIEQLKRRCDKERPSCGPCSRANAPCVYLDRTKERRFTADQVERLERRIRQVEAHNRQLSGDLERAKAAVVQYEEASPAAADAVTEVSYLSINAAGERQPYLGSTSGLLFADLVRSSVDVPSSQPTQCSFTRAGGSELLQASEHPSRAVADLPTKVLATRLFAAYLDHDALLYPFLRPTELLEQIENFYSNNDYYLKQAPAFEVFVFHMVLAVATTHCFKHDWQMLPGAEIHHARAMHELQPVMAAGGIQSLQAVLLLCQYRTGSGVKDNSASMWHLVGIASRLCLELGLHRESTYPIQPVTDLPMDVVIRYGRQEVGRRCFYSLIAMDRITSNILGRPLAIQDDDFDTILPLEASNMQFLQPIAPTISGVSRMTIFNHVLRYRLFCGKLLKVLHRKRADNISLSEAMRLRDTLADELEQWRIDVGELKLPIDDDRERSCYLSRTWYEVLYANASLMIWRPSPLLTDTGNDQTMLQKIFDSAVAAVSAYSALHKTRKINYSWVTLQSIFMAGLSYIYAVSRHMRDRRQQIRSGGCCLDQDPSTIEVVNTTRACSNVLVAVAERWSNLRHCHEVFDRLSDAVLADSIKLQTAQQSTPQRTAQPVMSVSQIVTAGAHQEEITGQNSRQYTQSSASTLHSTGLYQSQLQTSPLAVDNEFLHCFDDLQHLYDQQQLEEPVMHLSNDWLGCLNNLHDANNYGLYFSDILHPSM